MKKLYTYIEDGTKLKIDKVAEAYGVSMSTIASRIIECHFKDKQKQQAFEMNYDIRWLFFCSVYDIDSQDLTPENMRRFNNWIWREGKKFTEQEQLKRGCSVIGKEGFQNYLQALAIKAKAKRKEKELARL